MDLSANSLILQSLLWLILVINFVLILPAAANTISADHDNLVYKQCSNQTSTNINLSQSSELSSLFEEFLIQSSQTKFYETSISNDHVGPVLGRFQCRNDLTQSECRNCMKNFPELSKNLCGSNIPVRIQLSGCYVHYQPDGIETSRVQLLHKTCSKYKVKKSRFEEVKDKAFAAVESGILSGNGFYETTYELIHVMAQCEESLAACDCGVCVSSAVQIAEEECKYSISGEAYLDSCFISYSYHGDEFGGYSFKGKIQINKCLLFN